MHKKRTHCMVLIKYLWVKVNAKIATILHYSLIAQIN